MATLTINGLDVSTIGIEVARAPNVFSAPAVTWDEVQRFGYYGAVVQNEAIQPKPFSFDLWLSGADFGEVWGNWNALLSTIALAPNAEIVMGGDTTVRTNARLTGATIQPESLDIPALAVFDWPATISFRAVENPFWQAVTQTSVGSIGSTPVALPMGGRRTWLQVKIAGPATNPTLTLKSSTGATAATLGFTDITLADASEFLCVDFKLKLAHQNTTGVFNEGTAKIGRAFYTVGSIVDGWDLQESLWVYRTESWPTLACSSGTATAYYNKQY